VPALGEQNAGLAMGLATACAIGGRTVVGWVMPGGADRRLIACAGYAVQIIGSLLFILAGGTSVPVLLLGVVLFGSGIGNATSLPPLIAQVEFVKDEVQRVISLIVAVAQATYAFAPAFFGALLVWGSPAMPNATLFFAVVAVVQGLAIVCFWAGRSRASG
jgi:MFS family permease